MLGSTLRRFGGLAVTQVIGGSTPSSPASLFTCSLIVEHAPVKRGGVGANPTG